jgi:hypothetical protein
VTPIYISYHAGPGYAAEAAQLRASLDALGLDHHIAEEPDRGSWIANCAAKPEFIRSMRANLEGPLVWLDADARVRSAPDWSSCDGADLAYHLFRGYEVLTGTLYIGDTEGAREILAAWCDLTRARPGEWDQRVLGAVLDDAQIDADSEPRWDVRLLPESYCRIDRLHAPGVVAVIEQTQASRRLKQRA